MESIDPFRLMTDATSSFGNPSSSNSTRTFELELVDSLSERVSESLRDRADRAGDGAEAWPESLRDNDRSLTFSPGALSYSCCRCVCLSFAESRKPSIGPGSGLLAPWCVTELPSCT